MRSRKVRGVGWTGTGMVVAAGLFGIWSGVDGGLRLEPEVESIRALPGDTVRVGVVLRWDGAAPSPEGTLVFERMTGGRSPWRVSFSIPPLEPDMGIRAEAPVPVPWALADTIRILASATGIAVAETLFIEVAGPIERIERELPGEIPVDLRLDGGRAVVVRGDGSTVLDLDSESGDRERLLPGTDLALHGSFALLQVGGVIERHDLLDGGVEILSDPDFRCFLPAAGDSFSLWFRNCCGTFGEWSVHRRDGARSVIPLGPASVGRPSVEERWAVWAEHDAGGNRARIADLATGETDTLWEGPWEMDDPALAGGLATGVVHRFTGSRVVRAERGEGGVDTLFAAKHATVRSLAPEGPILFWLESRGKGWIVRAMGSRGALVDIEPLPARRWSLRAEGGRVLWIEGEGERFFLRGYRFDPAPYFREEEPALPSLRARIEGVRVGADRVTIEWRLDGAESPVEFAVFRSGDSEPALREVEIGRGTVPGPGYYVFVDRALPTSGEGRQRVRYSLRIEAAEGPLRIGPVAVLLPERFDRIRVAAAGPNPARGDVRFTLGVPAGEASGRAGFRVYDGRGRLLRAVDLGPVRAGATAVRWDGKDDRGRDAAPGVYFIRIRAGDRHRETRKVVRLAP